jgi:hypothetical protein
MRRKRRHRLNYKKALKKREKACQHLKVLIRMFSSDDWMYFIADMDMNEQRGDPSNYIKAEMFTLEPLANSHKKLII